MQYQHNASALAAGLLPVHPHVHRLQAMVACRSCWLLYRAGLLPTRDFVVRMLAIMVCQNHEVQHYTVH